MKTKKNNRRAAVLVAGAVIAGAVAVSPLAVADATGYCVIPAWKTAETISRPVKPYVRNAEVFDIEPDSGFVQVRTADLHVEVTPKIGIIPNAVQSVNAAQNCPITEDELVIMAKVLKRECGGLKGVYGGVSAKARQAAVVWCALNRLDSEDPYYPDTLAGVLTQSGAFAWIPDTYVDTELLDLARDVVGRWWREKNGETDVGRTLPKEYLFFAGRNGENHFRDKYSGNFTYWDWSLADPYTEE